MSIFFSPTPPLKPNPSVTVADAFAGSQDIYIGGAPTGVASVGLLGTGFNAGKIAYGTFNPATSYLGITGANPKGKGDGLVPGLISSVLSLDNITAVGQPASFVPISVYGGAANPSTTPCPYTVTVDALPDGLTLYTSVTTIDVTGLAPTQDATFQVTFTFTAGKLTGLSPVVGKFYAVRGQAKLSYNGIWECKAVTATSITLKYNASPAASGGTGIANQVSWSTTSLTTITDIGQKAIADSGGVFYWYNYTEILIAGTPTSPLTKKSFTVRFTDATGQSKTESFNLEITGGAQPLDTVLDPYNSVLSQNVAVSFTPVRALGGTGTKTFTAPGGLPSGLSINSSGLISGTPNPASGLQTYTILVTDGTGATSSKSITLEVKAPAVNVALAQSSPYSYVATVPFTEFKPILGTGGIAPLSYTVLPAVTDYGLTFTSTGTVRGPGTTVTGGLKSFEVTVSDSNTPPTTNKLSFSLEIAALPALIVSVNSSTISLTKNSSTGLPTSPISASAGYLNKSFTITNTATLASVGLSFSSAGVLSGTPSGLLSSTPFIVTVTDQAPIPQIKTATFTLSVLSVPLKTTLAVAGKISGIVSVPITTTTPVTATGGDGAYKYSIAPDITAQLGLAFTTVTNGAILGGTISGTSTVATSGVASYTVTVTDAALQTSSTAFTIQIDNPLPLTVASIGSKTLLHRDPVNPAFTPVSITSPGYSTLKYAITGTNNVSLPPGLNFNTSNGEITGTPSTYLITATTFSVTVTDQAKQAATGTFTLTVNTRAISPTVITPKVFTKLVANSYQPVTVTGGSEVYSYAINPSPSLPPNLSFSTVTGVLSGTAESTSTAGSNTYTVTVTDSLNTQSVSTFVLTVQNAPALLSVSSISSSTFYKNESIGTAITPVTIVSPGSGQLKFETLPTDLAADTGLTFSTTNGQISGSPSTYVNKTYTIKVTDGLGQTTSQPYALIVTYRPLATTQAVIYSQLTKTKQITAFTPVTASYGAGGTTFSLSTTTNFFPAGLNFNNVNGEITGKPTELLNTATFTVTATDSANNTSSKSFELYVKNPPALSATASTSSVITLTLDSAFTTFTPVIAAGGDGTIVYTKPPGLPSGLIFDLSSGVISGRASNISSTASYIVTATDTLSQTASASFLLNVIPKPITISIDHPTVNGTALEYINPIIPISAQGSGNLTYTLDRSLPSPLQFVNGVIDGTPLSAINETFTVEVSDTYGQTNSGNFQLVINEIIPDPLVATAGQSIYSLEIYSTNNFQPVSAVGGVGTYTYSILPTTLPAGLEFDILTGNLLGQVETKFSSTNYVVTVYDKKPQSTTATFNLEVIIPVITAGKGYSGSRGFNGSKGFTGSRGYTGSIGYTGSASTASGYIGSTGYTGSQGNTGYIGSTGYTGSASTASGYIGSTGYTGSVGYVGSQGETGYWGSVGYWGSEGYVGSFGFTGSQGFTGSFGFTGSHGYSGSRGIQGIQGVRGPEGDQGVPGNDGNQGDKGDPGFVGSQGVQGDLGFTGSMAYTGSAGYAGSQGETGFVGSQGIPGEYAALGYFGSTGYTGSEGYAGSKGESSFVYSETAPLDPVVGDRWLDAITGAEVVFTDDGISSQWIEVAASGFLGKTGDIGYWGSVGYRGSVGYVGSEGYTGSAGSGYTGSNGVNTRSTIAGTSDVLTNRNTGTINITAFKGYNLYKIQTSAAAWVRIYATSAARTDDQYRLSNLDPASDAGVITEVITTMSQTITLTPAVLGFNDENPVTNIIPISVTNYSGASTSITVTLTMVQTEA